MRDELPHAIMLRNKATTERPPKAAEFLLEMGDESFSILGFVGTE